MKAIPISPNAIQLIRYGLVNCYLVREQGADSASDSFTLIDTTTSGAAPDILAAAARAGAPIRRILLTHAHVDHVGSVDALVLALAATDKLPEVAASARSIPLLLPVPDLKLTPGEPVGKIKGKVPGITSTVTHTMAHGELYGSLRCISTPGHIPGHFSYLDERDGTLYAGDALVGVRKLSVSGYAPWYFPLPNAATWDKPTAIASARQLLHYPIQRFACGHGALREGGLITLKAAIAQAT